MFIWGVIFCAEDNEIIVANNGISDIINDSIDGKRHANR